ncbi:MAG: 50S ribosomal protein L6 [Candidatus Paceibacterota bacterium]
MSRIGKQLITIPEKTTLMREGDLITIKGPLGELSRNFKKDVEIMVSDEGTITLKPTRENIASRALWGTYASHLVNMIQGVNTPYQKKLIVEGVGFRVEVSEGSLTLHVGFSHPVVIKVPKEITVSVEKNTIHLSGIDKEMVGRFAAEIRAVKKPEPYKGKGIRYEDEVVRRKQGKKTV